jgi:hypothetical protein
VFKNADLNYLIHVEVLNQRLVGEEVIQFMPLRNVSAARFTEVYGDGFISGFLEGGSFNALVSVKLSEQSSSNAIERALTNAFVGLSGLEDHKELNQTPGVDDVLASHRSSIS